MHSEKREDGEIVMRAWRQIIALVIGVVMAIMFLPLYIFLANA